MYIFSTEVTANFAREILIVLLKHYEIQPYVGYKNDDVDWPEYYNNRNLHRLRGNHHLRRINRAQNARSISTISMLQAAIYTLIEASVSGG